MFSLSSYTDPTGRSLPCYSLTKTECLYVATKFNDEARAKLVLRWEQLETERLQQKAIRHLLVTDSDIMNEAERIMERRRSVYWLHFAVRPADNRRIISFIIK